ARASERSSDGEKAKRRGNVAGKSRTSSSAAPAGSPFVATVPTRRAETGAPMSVVKIVVSTPSSPKQRDDWTTASATPPVRLASEGTTCRTRTTAGGNVNEAKNARAAPKARPHGC